MIAYKYIFSFFVFLLFQQAAFAVTYVGQNIEKDAKWLKANSPYVVTTDIAIHKGATLTIEPGTKVFFSKETSLIVAGSLVAQGTKGQKIAFAGHNNYDWNGFLFTKECNDYSPETGEGCIFEYCSFTGTGQSPAQLIRSKGCDLKLVNCSVEDCYTAIQTERQAEVWVYKSTFDNCNRVLNVRNTSSATIEGNKMTNCNSIMLGGTTSFKNNTLKKFTGRGRHSGVVVWMLGGGVVDITGNDFSNFNTYAIKLHKMTRRSSFIVKNNKFKNNATNLKLSSKYYNHGKSTIENNNFYNYKKYHVEVTGSRSNKKEDGITPTLVIGVNYWGRLSREKIKEATLDMNTNEKITAQVEYKELAKKAIKL